MHYGIKPSVYDPLTRFNHWLTALVMIGMISFGLYLENADLTRDARGQLMGLHKSVGSVFLIYAIWRVGYRAQQGFPPPLASTPKWQRVSARFVHLLLLFGIVSMPASGLIMTLFKGRPVDIFGLLTIPAFEKNELLAGIGHVMHGIGANVLIAAIGLHILAALKHHIIDKDLTLSRMIGTRSSREVQ